MKYRGGALLLTIHLLLRGVGGQATDYCELLADVLSICEAETPNFTLLAPTVQADCVCGSTLDTIAWGPATFEALAAECAIQYATIDVTVASDAFALETFCDVYYVAAETFAAATSTPSASLLPATTRPTVAVASSTSSTDFQTTTPSSSSSSSAKTPLGAGSAQPPAPTTSITTTSSQTPTVEISTVTTPSSTFNAVQTSQTSQIAGNDASKGAQWSRGWGYTLVVMLGWLLG
ncbi:hypothetical protein PV08_09679 [Exophiala spinifera]|uniref:Extracellular membrane protein CFEM domain-containing protein n=1 Tax=Exophiala spinifera TaxID=91928 RepID=A0A0D1ZHL0_9EURO|nr:uncharacterized protein PV08_09679 [Exophiala spinifera]KIW12402.1 hypothetical protein PV08_09679 [Exophiala spinifera]